MGVVVEKMADERGLVWPANIAPFRVHLVSLGKDDIVHKAADELYNSLSDQGYDVLWDDRDASAGEKFADADLIGIPTRIIVSQKTLESGALEVRDRKTGEEMHLGLHELKKYLASQ